MRAYKCDSCGNFFTRKPSVQIFYVRRKSNNNLVDLCPDCNKKINKLIRNIDKEEEDNDESQREF